MVVACGVPDLTRDRPPRALEAMNTDGRCQQGGPNHSAGACVMPLVECGEHAIGAVHAGQEIADRRAELLRVVRCRAS
ncbi:hypothetical protein RW1_031_01520 [Rhodococcus wratislaviensis NBRC 100605]|uniref:Uncharacterized protein n=1 Tax=Rhodococcus wratislaviensis NBRC 100605 TaxID=1219028 RepID=X0Q5M6_RHOWR|nr:hypothetical protein RW1_031_01520 [Rhodococcus wratislaviensis NBRC 100605]